MSLALALGMVFLAYQTPAGAQLADALRDTDQGIVRFTQPLRPDTHVCDHGIHTEHRTMDTRDTDCLEGTAEVEIGLSDGRVDSVRLLRPRDARSPSATELGRVSGQEAADALLGIAAVAASRVAEDAIVAAVFADSVEVWPQLLTLARDRERPGRVRRSALFWLGQQAASAVTGALAETATDDESAGIRDAAVFALSQRPPEEGVPVLMDLARTASHADTRRSALFWLAQSDDPRVPDFFADLLRGPA